MLVTALLPQLVPQRLVVWWVVAAAAWTLVFALYPHVSTPWVLITRLDAKDG